MTRAHPEHVEQSLFFQRVELDSRTRHVLITAVPNAGGFQGGFKSNVIRVERLRDEGVKAGVPDVLVFTPSFVSAPEVEGAKYTRYNGLALEFKIKPNGPTPAQLEWIDRLRGEGWAAQVVYSAEEAFSVLASYLGFLP